MEDPFAPPADPPRSRDAAPTPSPYAPYATATTVAPPPGWTEEQEAATRRHDRQQRWRSEREREAARPQPASPGVFWTVAAIGIGLLLLGRLVLYFAVVDGLPAGTEAPALLAVLGVVALSAGLCLAGLLQRGLGVPARIALLVSSGFFAVAAAWPGLSASLL